MTFTQKLTFNQSENCLNKVCVCGGDQTLKSLQRKLKFKFCVCFFSGQFQFFTRIQNRSVWDHHQKHNKDHQEYKAQKTKYRSLLSLIMCMHSSSHINSVWDNWYIEPQITKETEPVPIAAYSAFFLWVQRSSTIRCSSEHANMADCQRSPLPTHANPWGGP
jgi:hypothetical protein